MSAMAKAQRPTVIVGGGGQSGGFSFKLNTAQARNVQQILGKTKSASSSKAASKADSQKRSK
jgi:prephenate dehydrogenase